MCVCLRACVCECVYVCVYACVCACVYVCIRMCVYYLLIIESLQKDDTIEKWGSMRENTYRHFHFTPRIVRFSLIWLVLVPVGLFALLLTGREDTETNWKEGNL